MIAMDEVGVGIIGSGFMGSTWAETVRRTPGARLSTVAGGRRAPGDAASYDVPADKWKCDPLEQSVYADWAAHACDITRWFAGSRPVLAFAAANSFTPEPPPEQTIMAAYQFENGVMADVWLTYEIPPPGLGS